jgi:redox-sensitive bicupin YhaK (pirin superfamily)
VFVSECDAGASFDLTLGPCRQAYLMCIEGSLQANQQLLGMRDAAEVVGAEGGSTSLQVRCLEQGAHFIVLEMAAKG